MLLSNTNANGIAAYVFTSDGTTRQGGLQYNNKTNERNLFSCTYTEIPYYFGTNNIIRLMVTGSTGNIIIQNGGTFTDSGERLQVTGTMKVTGASSFGESLTISKNSNAVLGLIISNTTAGTGSNPYLQLVSDATAGSAQVFKYSSTRTPYKTIAASDFGHYNATAGDISFLNDFASGAIKFTAGGSSTAHMTIKSNGRINMSSLPTSPTGLSSGDLWNNLGMINIV
jgi:hypothetical protein